MCPTYLHIAAKQVAEVFKTAKISVGNMNYLIKLLLGGKLVFP